VLDDRRAKKVPKQLIGRIQLNREVRTVLDRIA